MPRRPDFVEEVHRASNAIKDPVEKLRFIRESLERQKAKDAWVQRVPLSPVRSRLYRWLRMDGPEVFRAATRALVSSAREVLDRAGVTAEDIDAYVPHQANRRIIDAATDRLGLDPEQVVITLDHHGNTSAASIPLALDVAVKDGRVKRGDLVLLEAMGGGFTWGAVLMRW